MSTFEILYIVKPYEIDNKVEPFDENVVIPAIVKIRKKYAENKIDIDKAEDWGVKKLAYEVQGYHEGYYVLDTVVGEISAIKNINIVTENNEDVLRHMIIRQGD